MPAAASFQAVFLQAPIHRATAKAQSLGGLADVSVVACQRALNQMMLNVIEAHLFEPRASTRSSGPQSQIGRTNQGPGSQQHSSLNRVIQFAYIARPGMLVKNLRGDGIESTDCFAVALRITAQKMVRQQIDVVFTLAQR